MVALHFAMPALGDARAIVGLTFQMDAEFGVPPPRPLLLGRLDVASGALAISPCPPACLGGGPLFYGPIARADRSGSYVLYNDPGRWLRRIDASTATILESVPLATPAHVIVRAPFDDVFVSGTWDGSSIGWYDGNTRQDVGSIAFPDASAPGYLSQPAFSADGAYLFVVDHGRLTRIEARTHAIAASRDVGFDFTPIVDRRTGRIYGIDKERLRAIGFNPATFDVEFDMPVSEESDGSYATGAMAVDHRGRLWIEVDASPIDRRVTILDPETGLQVGDLVLRGRSFVPGYRSDRILRVGPDASCGSGPFACRSDQLFEYAVDGRILLRAIPLEFRAGDDAGREHGRVMLAWIAFLPDSGTAVEYYHAGLDHYFLTTETVEIDALDRGILAGWQRTGQSFGVLLTDGGPESWIPVCRYYGRPDRGLDSHFYSASEQECAGLATRYDGSWVFERRDAFYAAPADATTGACPNGTEPVYRLWNARFDSNHRYTTSAVIKAEMIARGYVPEGYGPDNVAFCVRKASG
jgi:hypothetical protein